jgi:hypothetical protein
LTNETIDAQQNNNDDPLGDIEEWAKPSSKFVRLQVGLPMVLEFDRRKITKESFDYKKGRGPQDTILFKVRTPNEDDSEVEKDFRVTSKRLVRSVLSHLNKGLNRLEITKHGSNETTTYDVVADTPPVSSKQQQL